MKKLLYFLSLFFFTATAFAQQSGSLLWEVSGKGLKSSSYLFGTYHLITSTFIDSFPVIHSCYAKTEEVVGELLLDASMAQKMMAGVIMKDSTLDQLLNKEEYKLVGDYLKETSGMNIALFNKMKPVLVQTMFYKSLLSGEDKGHPMDVYFQEIAKADGKKVEGLETMEEQMAVLFDGTSLKRQAELLVKAVREKDKNTVEMMRINGCYRAGDLECLAKSMTDSTDFSKEEMNQLLYSRNRNWMKKLPGIFRAQPTFIAVGAGHLPGEGGLIDLLRKEGYTVTAVAVKK
jgi:uncharacterized protein YbaP (TraB family)